MVNLVFITAIFPPVPANHFADKKVVHNERGEIALTAIYSRRNRGSRFTVIDEKAKVSRG